jgi:hypothetical protein
MNTLQAGFSRVNITPALGTEIVGYFHARYAEGVLDELEINALALSTGEDKVVLMSADLCFIGTAVQKVICEHICAATGLAPNQIFIHSTHTHTGPVVNLDGVNGMRVSGADETKQELAKQYGCYEKYYKGKYQKKIIAIICPELESAYYNAYVEKLQKLIKKHDGIALISSYDFETESQEELLDYYISHLKVDGVFVLGMKAPLKKGYDIPVIALLSDSRNIKDSISVDLASAIQDALAYLNGLGHQNILFSGEASI